jgi:hypothetical protein
VLTALGGDKNKLVIDLSCRRRGEDRWFVATNKWQTITDVEVNEGMSVYYMTSSNNNNNNNNNKTCPSYYTCVHIYIYIYIYVHTHHVLTRPRPSPAHTHIHNQSTTHTNPIC